MNYVAILICGVAAMVIGSIWYGPFFGKFWMKAMGADKCTPEELAAAKKGMGGRYFLQFILALISAWALDALFMHWGGVASDMKIAAFAWFGFVMTTEGGAMLWNGRPKNVSWKMFLISASSALVTFIVYALILGAMK